MKQVYKILATACAVLTTGLMSLSAQNVQLHYDFGKFIHPDKQVGRPTTLLTVEQQSVDKFGDTFYFVDMNFQDQGAVATNWKFMRNIRFWNGPLSWHVRYDGGMRFLNSNTSEDAPRAAMSIKDAFFTGVTYTYLRPDRKLMVALTPSYKYIKGHSEPHNWEAVAVWKYAPGNGLVSANGFFTYWREKMPIYGTTYRWMTQPQFWLNLNKIKGVSENMRLSVGTELRLSSNVDSKGVIFAPTLALKWNFGK